MTISHHPSDETLAAFAAGNLDHGRHVVVAAHIELCSHCQVWQSALEHMAGAMLFDCPPVSLSVGAFGRTLAQLDAPEVTAMQLDEIHRTEALPSALRGQLLGKWSWIGRGIHHRPVGPTAETGARVFMLKVDPGIQLPNHTHTGTEFTLVLSGAFSHAGGRFGPGDIEEADDQVEHVPVVDAGEACICLVAMDGKLKLLGSMGRMLQPFVRF